MPRRVFIVKRCFGPLFSLLLESVVFFDLIESDRFLVNVGMKVNDLDLELLREQISNG